MSKKFEVLEEEVEVLEEGPSDESRLGQQYSRRIMWATGNPEEPYLTLTSTAFTHANVLDSEGKFDREAVNWQNGEGKSDIDLPVLQAMAWELTKEKDAAKMPEESLELLESCVDEWVWHSDPEDVGGSEIRSEMERDDEVGYTYTTSIEKSNERCRNHVSGVDYFRNYSPENA